MYYYCTPIFTNCQYLSAIFLPFIGKFFLYKAKKHPDKAVLSALSGFLQS
nr:MAG TPA: hypothetical protein [Caudoviricetes sp.]